MAVDTAGSRTVTGEAERRPRMLLLANDAFYLYRFRSPIISEMCKRGYDVVAAAPRDGAIEAKLTALGATFVAWDVRRAGRNPLRELAALRELYRIFADVKPDLFFGYAIKPVLYGLPLSRWMGAKRRVVMIPGLGYAFTVGGGPGRALVRQIMKVAYRFALSFANTVIFQNKDDIELFRTARILNRESQAAKVNGSGVDPKQFEQAALPDGPPRFLFVGRLLRDKGIHDFLEAAERVKRVLPQAQFVVVGAADGNPSAIRQKELDEWIDRGIIAYRGHLDDPRPEYNACHVFVLPSYYREGVPRTCLEAISTGRAVITTDSPGCRETVEHGINGLLVPPRDVGRLADAMLQLARDLELTREMGERGRALCERRFHIDLVTRETADLIEGG